MKNRGTFLTLVTVKEKNSNDSYQDCNRARAAGKLQETMGNIITKDLLYTTNKILIPNCPSTCDDLKAANDIFGTSINYLKGKTVRKSRHHVRLEIERIPYGILDNYKEVTLTADIMFVKNIRFFYCNIQVHTVWNRRSHN